MREVCSTRLPSAGHGLAFTRNVLTNHPLSDYQDINQETQFAVTVYRQQDIKPTASAEREEILSKGVTGIVGILLLPPVAKSFRRLMT